MGALVVDKLCIIGCFATHAALLIFGSCLTKTSLLQAKQQAAPEAAKPAPPAPAPAPAPVHAPAPAPAPAANAVDMNQLQALLQQQQQQLQAHQAQQAQQAARAGMWPDQSSLWQLAQLQQMMQGQPQQMPCGVNQETLNAFAQAQLFQSMFGQAAGAVPQSAPAPAPMPNMNAPQPAPVNEGCGGNAAPAPPQFCMGNSGNAQPAAPKARKSNAKVRKHTSAAKIAKPEAVRPGAAQAPGRPDALSIMHG